MKYILLVFSLSGGAPTVSGNFDSLQYCMLAAKNVFVHAPSHTTSNTLTSTRDGLRTVCNPQH